MRISPRVLCKIFSWHLGLASSCKFQGKICPRSQDMWAPSQVCRHCWSRDKTDVKPCQMVLARVQIFPGCAIARLATFCYLDQRVLAPAQMWTPLIFGLGVVLGLREILMALVCFPISELFWGFCWAFCNTSLNKFCSFTNTLHL
jgi:hypothetical protein